MIYRIKHVTVTKVGQVTNYYVVQRKRWFWMWWWTQCYHFCFDLNSRDYGNPAVFDTKQGAVVYIVSEREHYAPISVKKEIVGHYDVPSS